MAPAEIAKPRRPIERLCVGCRQLRPREQLFRLVRLPDGKIVLDNKQQHHGRGAYVCRDRGCIEVAIRKGGFSKALRRAVPEELMKDVIALGQEMS